MQVEQVIFGTSNGHQDRMGKLAGQAQLVFAFGSKEQMREKTHFEAIRASYPEAHIIGCSTAGEICDTVVYDDTVVATAVHFDKTRIQGVVKNINDIGDSFLAGEQLADALEKDGLVHVFVISEGLKVNGSELVKGLTGRLPAGVTATGGLSGDAGRFEETLVMWDEEPRSGNIVALGLYGDSLKVGYGSLGGWDSFGPERLITRAEKNVLYELDGRSALELYKNYLGEHAKGLPATGLLFPLSIKSKDDEPEIVRTILSVDEEEQSITFAGDMPVGHYARLKKANFDRLIDGASDAAKTSHEALGSAPADLALLISCVGRKMVLKQRIEEEVESVRDVLGDKPALTGFYSYGEISPFTPSAKCELHNQTMTITTFAER